MKPSLSMKRQLKHWSLNSTVVLLTAMVVSQMFAPVAVGQDPTLVIQPDTADLRIDGTCHNGSTAVGSTFYLVKAAIYCYGNNDLLQFDMSSLNGIPASNIVSARLELYQLFAGTNYGYPWYDFRAGAYPDSGPWSLSTNWSTAPSFDTTANYENRINISNQVNVWRTWNVTQAVKDWVSGAKPNYGLRLFAIDEGQNADLITQFAAATFSDPTLGPKLIVNYITQPTACVAPPSNIVSWWKAEGNAADAIDGNDGTLVGGVTFAPGKVGQAFSLDGTTGYVEVGDKADLRFTNALTMEAWIYPTGAPAGGLGIIEGKQGEYFFSRWADGTIRWAFAITDPGYVWFNTGIDAPLNVWTHVAVTYNSGAIKTYVNGVLAHSFNGSSPIGTFDPNPGAHDFQIGNCEGCGQLFKGLIDEATVYNRALTDAEVYFLYAADGLGKCPPINQLFVGSEASSQVLRYDNLTGNFSAAFASTISYPEGLALGPDGRLYVASFGTGSVLRFDIPSGNLVGTFVSAGSGGLSSPVGIAFGPDGNLYVADRTSASILRYDGVTGAFMNTFASGNGMAYPDGFVFGPDGRLYVGSRTTNKILRFNATTGAFVDVFASDNGLITPEGLVFGPDGLLYVASRGSNSILRYNVATGPPAATFASGNGLNAPIGIAFGPDGNLYAANLGTNSVLWFRQSDGAFLGTFVATGSGGLNAPTFLFFSPSSTHNMPPTASAGPNQTVEATSASGADVTLSGSLSSDPDGDTLTYTWTGPFVTPTGVNPTVVMPLGTNTVTLRVDDGHGNTATATVQITVQDTTPPVLALPGNITAQATSASGAAVSYTATANDAVSGVVPVNCTPASGSMFAIGATLVNCSATDGAGNTANGSFQVTVTKASQTISFATLPNRTYGNSDFTVVATATSGLAVSFTAGATDNCTILGTTVHITGAGSCTVTAHQSGNAAYDPAADVPQSFAISKATASVTPTAASKTYATPDPSFAGTLTGFLASDNVTASYSRTIGETVAGGPYAISATLSPAGALSNYSVTYNTASFTINKANASVTPAAASKTYGTADPSFTGTLSGFLAADNVTASYSRAAGETVGGSPYTISATLSPGGVLGNYAITYNAANFTISPAVASVTPNAASKTYGGVDPVFTGVLTGFLAGDGVTASYGRTAGETVAGSPYTISATLAPAGILGNYNITYNIALFTINKANASVTPANASKTYGATDPGLSGTLTGFLASDGVTATYSRMAGETVAGSPYTINATLSPAGVLSNYNITYNTSSFTINQAAASVTPAAASKTYGTADPTFTGTLSGFLASDNVTATYSRTAGEIVASYAISTMLSPTGVLGNYAITYNTAAFTINKANASVTPAAAGKTYGIADPAFTGTLSGFLPTDSVTATYSRTAGETVGSYTMGATLSPVGVLGNYNVTYNTATFTINKANAFVTPNAASKTYGAADPAFTGTVSGFLATDGVTATYSRTAGETVAGSPYTITATLAPAGVLGNYSVTYNAAAFTINKANASVTPNGASKTYGMADPALSGTLSGFLAGDDVIATYSRAAGEIVAGSPYAISATLGPPGVLGNYNITYNTAAFTINKATLTVTASSTTKILDASNPALNNATYSGFKFSDGPSSLSGTLSCTTTATTSSLVGSYPITCTGQTSANYAIAYLAGTLKVLYAPAGGTCYGDLSHAILQPVNADGTSVWKLGRTIPVKFRVCDANGVSIGTPGVVTSFMLTGIWNGTLDPVDETVSATNVDTVFRWDSTAQQWIFNLGTSGLSAGSTYIYTITLNDGSIVTGTTLAGAGNASFQYGLR